MPDEVPASGALIRSAHEQIEVVRRRHAHLVVQIRKSQRLIEECKELMERVNEFLTRFRLR